MRPSGHEGIRHKLRGQTYKTMRASRLNFGGKPSQSGGWESEQQLRPLSSLSAKTFRRTSPPIAALGSTYHGCRTFVPRPPYTYTTAATRAYGGRRTSIPARQGEEVYVLTDSVADCYRPTVQGNEDSPAECFPTLR